MAIKVDAGSEGAARVRSSLSEINVIPLVDVVLVLLLVFMLTAPMMYHGIDVDLPRASSPPSAAEERLVLSVTKDRRLFLNDRSMSPSSLEAELGEFLAGRSDRTIFIMADSELAYGFVVEMMDHVRRAGVERVAMVTEPPPAAGR